MATVVTSPVSKKINTAFSPGYLSFSSTGPVSGVSGVGYFSGPHYEETQELTFAYKRVPYFRMIEGDITLSSMNAELDWMHTQLLIQLRSVIVTKRKVWDWYETSSYIQPQRFTLYSVSADEMGQTYGTPAAGTMSVQGIIATTQPYYYRRLWDDGIDNESDMGTYPLMAESGGFGALEPYQGDGYNYTMANHTNCGVSASPQDPMDWVNINEPQFWHALTQSQGRIKILAASNKWGGHRSCLADHFPNGGYIPTNIGVTNGGVLGFKPGTYSSDQDDPGDVQVLVDAIGQKISVDISQGGAGTPRFVRAPDALGVCNPEYVPGRHYWGN